MSEETSGSFTSRLFRKASANLAPWLGALYFEGASATAHALKSARVLKKIESHITDNLANLPTTPTAAPAAAPAEAK